jgi:uncharacterized protein
VSDPLIHPELSEHIQQTPIADTHEHQASEEQWINDGPADVLSDLIGTYVSTDFHGAHCDIAALDRAHNRHDMSVKERWQGIAPAWDHIRDTGYAEAMAIQACEVYGIEEITGEALEAAQPILDGLRKPGERLRLAKEVANIDHMQIDGGVSLPADTGGADFFMHDISWCAFSAGRADLPALGEQYGVEITDLVTLRRVMEATFDRYAETSTGVKSQHAYERTLRWEARTDADAERVLQKQLAGTELSESEKLCIGDWSWARGVELATEYGLPFKMHTGFYAGADNMQVDRIRSGHLCKLAIAYPQAKLVCMHMAYPYESELVAMAKQFRNIYADMCWAWSMNPYAGMEFVRKFLHASAANKLFVFGGDTGCPTGALAYAAQARLWLSRTLSMEVRDGFMSLKHAKEIATKVMFENQRECFPVERAQQALRAIAKD